MIALKISHMLFSLFLRTIIQLTEILFEARPPNKFDEIKEGRYKNSILNFLFFKRSFNVSMELL